jgi:hypothetical protein
MVPDDENRHPSFTVPLAAWAERTIAGIPIGDANPAAATPVA